MNPSLSCDFNRGINGQSPAAVGRWLFPLGFRLFQVVRAK